MKSLFIFIFYEEHKIGNRQLNLIIYISDNIAMLIAYYFFGKSIRIKKVLFTFYS